MDIGNIMLWICIGGVVGLLIGIKKGRAGLGFALGAVFCFIGWAIIYFMPEEGVKCRECLGSVPIGARKCKHCGSSLA